jgi:hypothetical protein
VATTSADSITGTSPRRKASASLRKRRNTLGKRRGLESQSSYSSFYDDSASEGASPSLFALERNEELSGERFALSVWCAQDGAAWTSRRIRTARASATTWGRGDATAPSARTPRRPPRPRPARPRPA